MRIECVGGGPAGLYFAILMKKADPANRIRVIERNRKDDTFGFGVVFSDATLEELERADAETYLAITRSFAHWDDIEIHFRGEVLTSTGHGFSGLSRKLLLSILQDRCRELGVELAFERELSDFEPLREADLVVAADGVNSSVREQYRDHFEPKIDWRPNRFVWLGTTFPFRAFTFYFKANQHGLFRVHAYRYAENSSTFIVECREEAWKKAGLDRATENDTIAYCEELFREELAGHRLIDNRSVWRSFPTVVNRRFSHGNVVLLGDAAHTAHFSIGSGTKLAMEDAILLRSALVRHAEIPAALASYEAERRPPIESFQRAAQISLEWFENTERYMKLEPIEFAFSLLTRSLRVTHENLKLRDPAFVARLDEWVVRRALEQVGIDSKGASFAAENARVPPPMFTPFRLRDLLIENRVVVSPMCQYSAKDGTIDDWHLVHLGSRALGGAGLVITEMTDVSADARITPGCAGMYAPEHVATWQRLVRFVKRFSRARIGMQLAHAGRKGSTQLMWEGIDEPLPDGNWPLISASALPYFPHSQVPKAMDRSDMDATKSDFVRAAQMSEEAGFDLLELHFAHGYLLSSFITPLTNTRTDEHGGSLENRMRYPLEVFDAVRAVWPAHKPISVRISATDWAPGGLTLDDAVGIGTLLRAHGCDIVDVSAGQTVPEAEPRYGRLFQTPFSELVRLEAGIPTMTVGNIQSYADVNSIIAAGRADLCVLARAHLYDPYWTRHAAGELGWPLEWPDQYKTVERYTPRFK